MIRKFRLPSFKKNFALIFSFFVPIIVMAQENEVEMADMMRENGKIYVVVAIVSIILLFLMIAVMNIDRKVRKIEKEYRKV